MMTLSRLILAFGFIFGAVRLVAADSMNKEILGSYVEISAALAADDLAAAKTAAAVLIEHAGMSDHKDIAAKADALAKADTIETAREKFKALSAAVEPLAANEKGYTVMYCPMADADWVQTSAKVQNPYYGKAMPSCGGPKKSR